MRLVSAFSAGKHPAAARPGRRVSVAACRARLTGARWSHQPQLRAESTCLVRKLAPSLARRVVEDGSVQGGLLMDIATRHLNVASSAGRHGHNPQVLDPDPAVAFGNVGRELMSEVRPAARLPRPQLGDLVDAAAEPFRVPASVVPLRPTQLASLAALQAE